MPVTPFHLGVGLLAKGLAPRRFSLIGFGLTQVAIDCESGYFLLQGQWPAHRFFHTALGASLLCALVSIAFMPLLHRLVSSFSRTADPALEHWLSLTSRPTWRVVLATAVLGVVGHVVPDGMMHSDMRPLAPFSDWNPLFEVFSVGLLHTLLALFGIVGFLLLERYRGRQF